jgi:hypothetical protein
MLIFLMAKFSKLAILGQLHCGMNNPYGRGIENFRMPPGQNMDDIVTIFRSGMWRLYYKLSNEGRKRFFNEFFPLLSSTKYSSP